MLSLFKFIIEHPLNYQHKLAALSRLLRWQIATRLIDQSMILPFVNDTQLINRRGMTGATGNWYCGLHELAEMSFVLHYLRAGDYFVDVGANVGSYTVLAAGAAGANTMALEPIPETFSNLIANIKLNNLEDLVDPRCIGLSNHEGMLYFTAGQDTMNRVSVDGDTGLVLKVPVHTLDAILDRRVPKLIKIDVEGHELKVIEGASNTLSSPQLQAVIMETNGSGAKFGVSDDDLFGAMKDFGIKAFQYDPFNRKLIAAGAGDANTIFLRDATAALVRCSAASSFQLVNGTI